MPKIDPTSAMAPAIEMIGTPASRFVDADARQISVCLYGRMIAEIARHEVEISPNSMPSEIAVTKLALHTAQTSATSESRKISTLATVGTRYLGDTAATRRGISPSNA